MELKNFGYSLKNIPLPNKKTYTKLMIEKTQSFLKRLRWKAFFFDNPSENSGDRKQNFRFKSEKCPSQNKEILHFENDMYEMISNLKFKDSRPSDFQCKMSKDIKDMKSSQHLYVPADKTTNLYKISTEQYQHLLHSNITANYRKAGDEAKSNIDREAKDIAEKLTLADRVECFAQRDSFITLKDHKENFPNNPKCRLINPAKSEIGLISKQLLESIISEVKLKTKVNQWRQTADVIHWFKNIDEKNDCRFLQLDIAEFYPSISISLLNQAIEFAKEHADISAQTLEIIMHSRKSLLFDKTTTWVKRDNPEFDVTMGSYDGAEVCELVGLFLLSKVKTEFINLDFGLYRDDGLGYVHKLPAKQIDRMRKDIIRLFQSFGLKIEISCNLHHVDFLDVSLDLRTGKYSPFRKPNDTPLYIHCKSNHPPSIIKQLPEMVSDRISGISCDANEFDKVKDVYNSSLKMSGFRDQISYKQPRTSPAPPRQRKRNGSSRLLMSV